jgi:hypothetical protein
MPIVMDWTVPFVAGLSLFVSLLTLYLAHLRGPNINLAVPGKVYPCHKVYPGTLLITSRLDEINCFVVVSNLLVANTGLRPGVLFSFQVDQEDSAVVHHEFEPSPDRLLPLTLSPGEGFRTRLSLQTTSESEQWRDFLKRKRAISVRITYRVSTSLGRNKSKTEELRIDLAPLREHVEYADAKGQSYD